jgi:cell division protein ZapA
MSQSAVEINILGKTYKMACPKGQEVALQDAAEILNDKIDDLKLRTKIAKSEQLAVMAALNFCHELKLEQAKNNAYADSMAQRIQMLQSTIENALIEKGLDR